MSNGKKAVCCMNCAKAMLHRYDNNPILAACLAQPQPWDDKFPYAVEVASVLRSCNDHEESDVQKMVQQRTKKTA